ncbi:MAG: O-antigen ligase family protein [Patescibacteria group bacterium]|jgi:hypothetical protein
MIKQRYSHYRWEILIILSFLFLASVFLALNNYLVTALIFGSLFFIFLFFLRPLWGLYLIAFFLPVNGWAFNFKFLEIPFIDLLALILLISFILRQIYSFFFLDKSDKLVFPVASVFALFFLSTLISACFSNYVLSSLWASFRWILFFYLAYVVVPFNLIKDRKTLRRVLVLLVSGGFLVAIMGVSSLFFQDWSDSFFRVRPLYILGDWIFGDNYNLLAEFLIISSWVMLSLIYWAKSPRQARFFKVLALILILVNLLTFGRTAWITSVLQILGYLVFNFYFKARKKIPWAEIFLSLAVVLIIASPFIFKMLSLQEANVSSTKNRVLLTQISLEALSKKPLFGHGTGSFVPLVADNTRFIAKYGAPLDSHGFGQKLLAENGLVGTVFFLIFIFLIFRKLYRGIFQYIEHDKLLLPLSLAAAGGFFYQVFNTSYYKGRIWLPIALALVALEIISNLNYERREEN